MAMVGREPYINPYTDIGFKKLFGTEMNKGLLISFESQKANRDYTRTLDTAIRKGEAKGCAEGFSEGEAKCRDEGEVKGHAKGLTETVTRLNAKAFKTGYESIHVDEWYYSVKVPVTSISLNKTSASLSPTTPDNTVQLTATVYPSDATDKTVTWSSSNNSVATVSNSGLVTAVAEGTATITCKANDGSGVTATCDVSVIGHVVAEINETNFPDENFRNWILAQNYGKDGMLTEKEIQSVTSIELAGTSDNPGKIKSLKGIEYFTA